MRSASIWWLRSARWLAVDPITRGRHAPAQPPQAVGPHLQVVARRGQATGSEGERGQKFEQGEAHNL